MTKFLKAFTGRYRRAILHDVQGDSYERNSRWIAKVYFGFLTLFAVVYVLFFNRFLLRNMSVFRDLHEASFDPAVNPAIRLLVYKYEYLFYFMIFFILLVAFLIVGFFSFDLMQRNAIIKDLIQKNQEKGPRNGTDLI